jgi:hypothetical protein
MVDVENIQQLRNFQIIDLFFALSEAPVSAHEGADCVNEPLPVAKDQPKATSNARWAKDCFPAHGCF